MNQDIKTILKDRFGYDEFRPLQEEIVQTALDGRDCLALMPTGAGKSLCYQIPAIAMDGAAIVVSPLIALMKDQVDALKSAGVAAAFLNSAQSRDEQNAVRKAAFENNLDLLYVAPERIPSPAFRAFLESVSVSLIAVDEAHCISEWGHEFRPEYRNLKALRAMKPAAPVMALTATATERARADIASQLELRDPRVFIGGFDRPNLRYSVLPDRNRNDFLDAWIRAHPNESAIVYRSSRAGTEETAERLAEMGVRAVPYHAGLDEKTRTRNQEKFVRDEARVIAATVAFGMGIDKPDARLVMHYESPPSVERYYQESGRAGRDGLEAECVLFYGQRDRERAAYFIAQMEGGVQREAAERSLEAMVAYCETPSCRRAALLAHFGETYDAEGGCENCDNCLAETFDATVIAQKILSAVIRTGERYGAAYVAQVLRGDGAARIRQRGHEALSVFGIVDDFSETAIKELAASLRARGLLAARADMPTLSVTPKGREFLRSRESVRLPVPTRAAPTRRSSSALDPAADFDAALFEILRALRARLASERGFPPYVVFGDRSLREMCHYFPQTAENLLGISGVGQRKMQDYGAAFLEAITAYARENGVPDKTASSGSAPAAPPRDRDPRRRSTRRYEKTLPLADLGMPVSEIANRLGLRETTVAGHVEELIATGTLQDPTPYLPEPRRLDRILSAIEAVGDARLKPIYQHLNEAFDYEEIRFARAHFRAMRGE